jgi:hypothetical protein
MIPEDFKRKGHVRPSAYVRESHPQMGIKLYDHWIGPEDLEAFARWIIGAHEWCKVQLKNEAAKEFPKSQDVRSVEEPDQVRPQEQRQKKRR